jgi:hypothetical protein
MLRKLSTALISKRLLFPVHFSFGGGEHHEIDYHAVVTKNTKSGSD